MSSFRLENVYDYLPSPGNGTPDVRTVTQHPATDRTTVGAAFKAQTAQGTRMTDPFDDRVDYLADVMGMPTGKIMWSLPSDDQAVGQASMYGGLNFGGITYAEDPEQDLTDWTQTEGGQVQIVTSPRGNWFDTLRKWAGYPLRGDSDVAYGNATNDTIGQALHDVQPLQVAPGVRIVSEKADGIPMRYSGHPIQVQAERAWDTLLGSWPWTGDKATQQQPVVSTPLFFADPIEDGIPGPTGAMYSMVPNTPSFTPQALTWRTPPSPWDTGQTDGAGTFIDAGTLRGAQ